MPSEPLRAFDRPANERLTGFDNAFYGIGFDVFDGC